MERPVNSDDPLGLADTVQSGFIRIITEQENLHNTNRGRAGMGSLPHYSTPRPRGSSLRNLPPGSRAGPPTQLADRGTFGHSNLRRAALPLGAQRARRLG